MELNIYTAREQQRRDSLMHMSIHDPKRDGVSPIYVRVDICASNKEERYDVAN